ncbi:hypothetical protein [Mesorhizobium sp.]|uniref:hypothetical protein n=1 Tax=Mesorhizobium sp. TaxID=1871066 RepID=UPI0025D10C8B|nr:hypothetical protein [Mesorhizobium sp.]
MAVIDALPSLLERDEGIANDGDRGKQLLPTKRAVIGDRPDLNRAWEEEKPVRLLRMMRLLG